MIGLFDLKEKVVCFLSLLLFSSSSSPSSPSSSSSSSSSPSSSSSSSSSSLSSSSLCSSTTTTSSCFYTSPKTSNCGEMEVWFASHMFPVLFGSPHVSFPWWWINDCSSSGSGSGSKLLSVYSFLRFVFILLVQEESSFLFPDHLGGLLKKKVRNPFSNGKGWYLDHYSITERGNKRDSRKIFIPIELK